MVQKKKPKAQQGKHFRLEIAFIEAPQVIPASPVLGEECTIEAAVLGYPVGTDVTFEIYEPHSLHDGPVDTLSGQTPEEGSIVSLPWTFDYAAKKDDLSRTSFVCLGKVGDYCNVSEPFHFVQRYETTVKDGDGNPIPNLLVLLRPARGAPITAATDEEGRRTDEEGRRTDEEARRTDEEGKKTDEEGRTTDSGGKKSDEEGRPGSSSSVAKSAAEGGEEGEVAASSSRTPPEGGNAQAEESPLALAIVQEGDVGGEQQADQQADAAAAYIRGHRFYLPDRCGLFR